MNALNLAVQELVPSAETSYMHTFLSKQPTLTASLSSSGALAHKMTEFLCLPTDIRTLDNNPPVDQENVSLPHARKTSKDEEMNVITSIDVDWL